MRESLPIAFAAYPLLLSGMVMVWLFSLRTRSWLNWTVWVLACGSIFAFAFMTGSWAFSSYYLRYLFLGLFAAVAAFSFYRTKRPSLRAQTSDSRIIVPSVFLILFTVLDGLAIASYYPSGKTFDVDFPFKLGTYYVLQGGANIVTNPFHAVGQNKLAIDIVKLNSIGNRADGIAPRALSDYRIFGEKLYSPCQGSIFEVRDSLPDNLPGNPDITHPEGNYIVLKCAEGNILMAHLRQSSINVVSGDVVTMGQHLAEIGNSGNTLEPHLHIEATKDGKAVRLTFNGQTLSINSLIQRQ